MGFPILVRWHFYIESGRTGVLASSWIPIMTVIILFFVVYSTCARVICNNTAQPLFTEFVSMMCFRAHFERLNMKWDLVTELINHANRMYSLNTMYVVSGSISCSRKYQYNNDTKITCTVVLQGVGSFFPSGSWGSFQQKYISKQRDVHYKAKTVVSLWLKLPLEWSTKIR